MPGFIGSCSYSQRNLFGLNQKLTAALEAGQSDSTFRISHTDPWVRGDPHRTSRTISLQSAKTSGEYCTPLYTYHLEECVPNAMAGPNLSPQQTLHDPFQTCMQIT